MSGSISLISIPNPIHLHPFSNTSIKIHRPVGRSTRAGRISASGRDHDHDHDQAHHHHDGTYGGRLVDESMIVLRRRMHEMKVVERNYEPPADWMEWEKEWYGSYDSAICGLVGILQTQMMNARPSLVLGVLALVAVSVPTTTAVTVSYLVDMMSMVAGIHHPS